MAMHETIGGIQTAALHTSAAGLTITSLSAFFGWVSPIVAVLAGVAAIVAYTLEIIDWMSRHRKKKK